MTDEDVELNVSDELFWDPKIDSSAVAVSVRAGVVTLRGTVGSLRQKREARKAAERVWGVTGVNDLLSVEILSGQRREDADLRGDVLQALMLDSLVPPTIDAKVNDGFVTLEGTAEWQYQRDEAEFLASNVLGVLGVTSDVRLPAPMTGATDVQESIERAFTRAAKIDADDLAVATSNGTVTLTGTVRSWSERDAAVAAAWAAPGVRAVEDRLSVTY